MFVVGCGGDEDAPQAPARDYVAEYEALMEAAQPPGENAWPVLLRVGQRVKALEDEARAAAPEVLVNLTWFKYPPESQMDPRESEFGRQVIQRAMQEGLLEELVRAASLPRLLPPLELKDDLLYSRKYEFTAIRQAFLALTSAAWLCFEQGESDRAIEHLCAGLRLSCMLSRQGVWIDRLVAESVRQLLFAEIRLAVIERSLSESQLQTSLDAIWKAEFPPLSAALEAEHLVNRQLLEVAYSGDPRFTREDLINEVRKASALSVFNNEFPEVGADDLAPRDQILTVLDDTFARAKQDSERIVRERSMTRETAEEYARQLGPSYIIVAYIIPVLPQFLKNADRGAIEDAGTRTLLAIELFRLREGRLPEDLSELVPEYLSELLRDPITGGTLHYRVPGKAKWRQQYLLYAAGLDGEDNGGNFDEWMDDVALHSEEHGQGYDYVFNLPRFIQPQQRSR